MRTALSAVLRIPNLAFCFMFTFKRPSEACRRKSASSDAQRLFRDLVFRLEPDQGRLIRPTLAWPIIRSACRRPDFEKRRQLFRTTWFRQSGSPFRPGIATIFLSPCREDAAQTEKETPHGKMEARVGRDHARGAAIGACDRASAAAAKAEHRHHLG